jgi:hypothetical protein
MGKKKDKQLTIDHLITKIQFNDKIVELADRALPIIDELLEELYDCDEPDETLPLDDMIKWIRETILERKKASIDNYKTIQYAQKLK